MWKWLLIVFLLLVVGCVGSGYYLQSSGKLDELMKMVRPDLKPTEVRAVQAERGDLVRTVSAPGQVEPRVVVEISAQVSARIIALPFRENQQVRKGDVVVRLDARDLAALLDSAKAQLRSEEARLEGARAAEANARTEYDRRVELFATKDIAQSELDTARAELRRAESGLRVAEHAIEIARANIVRAEKDLDNTVITAPFDGVITTLNAEVGETVVVGTLNNPGSVIMEIADLGVMVLTARIDEANIAPVVEGQKARIFVNAYPERAFTGTVEKVGLKRLLDRDGTAYFEAEILVDLPEGVLLRSGLTANADIEVETFRDVVKVPSQGVLDRAREDLPSRVVEGNANIDASTKFARVVYIMKDGKAQPVPVQVGASDLTHTVVLAGLDAGTPVIVGPFKALVGLRHDQLVVEQKAPTPATATPADATASTQPQGAG
ncbi:MAG: efflux RND transporter periplasmic adaptor subunit [Planctomycetota bacterium]|nr:efflux RND transporter periplasmic adaptor subunit [Planctomycetota bacterium]